MVGEGCVCEGRGWLEKDVCMREGMVREGCVYERGDG
jgi:hypothetical protein